MKNVNVRIRVNDPRANAKVGDKVEFQIEDEIIQDTITDISSNRIEGEVFELTNVKFRIVGK